MMIIYLAIICIAPPVLMYYLDKKNESNSFKRPFRELNKQGFNSSSKQATKDR